MVGAGFCSVVNVAVVCMYEFDDDRRANYFVVADPRISTQVCVRNFHAEQLDGVASGRGLANSFCVPRGKVLGAPHPADKVLKCYKDRL
jgi:hypothetical protein